MSDSNKPRLPDEAEILMYVAEYVSALLKRKGITDRNDLKGTVGSSYTQGGKLPIIQAGDTAALSGKLAIIPYGPNNQPKAGDTVVMSWLGSSFVAAGELGIPSTEGGFETGMAISFFGQSAPVGWIMMDGGTIGSAASGSTARANADTASLFAHLWANFTNAQLPIQNSNGTAGSRGVSAAADFAANKRLPLPDMRTRTPVMKAASGSLSTFGESGGEITHVLTTGELPAHEHSIYATSGGGGTGVRPLSSVEEAFSFAYAQPTAAPAGGGGAHNNMPPYFVVNWIIRL